MYKEVIRFFVAALMLPVLLCIFFTSVNASETPEENPEEFVEFDNEDAAPRMMLRATSKYKLRIDVINQVVSAYTSNGKLYRQMICSTGKTETPTPLGTFSTSSQYRWGYFSKFGVWAQYWTRISGPYLFHSVLYNEKDEDTLVKSSLNNLGNRASHGCVRLRVEDAKWIYDNCQSGTQVVIFEGIKDSKYNSAVKSKGALEGKNLYLSKSTAPDGKSARIKVESLNLRAKANTSSKILTTLQRSDSFQVLSTSSGWARVFFQGIVGYVFEGYINYSGDSDEPKEPDEPSSNVLYTGIIATSGSALNMRREPNVQSGVITSIPNGSKVNILEVSDDWYRVEYSGKYGYCARSYIKVIKEESYDSGVVSTNGGTLNLRAEPNSSSEILAEIPNRTKVNISSYVGSWAEISYSGKKGFVSTQYLTGMKKYSK